MNKVRRKTVLTGQLEEICVTDNYFSFDDIPEYVKHSFNNNPQLVRVEYTLSQGSKIIYERV